MMLLTLFACARSTGGFNGDRVTEPPTLPDFHVVNQDGEPRTRADLLCKPTVMWFYPAALTYG